MKKELSKSCTAARVFKFSQMRIFSSDLLHLYMSTRERPREKVSDIWIAYEVREESRAMKNAAKNSIISIHSNCFSFFRLSGYVQKAAKRRRNSTNTATALCYRLMSAIVVEVTADYFLLLLSAFLMLC